MKTTRGSFKTPRTIQEALDYYSKTLSHNKIPRAQREVQIFLQSILNFSEVDLITRNQQELSRKNQRALENMIQRRIQGEPNAYIIGKKDFYKSSFKVSPDVLIPRPETELLVEEVTKFIRSEQDIHKIADFGCGSGCIGLSALIDNPQTEMYMIDICEKALRVAKENAQKLGVFDRCSWFRGDVVDFHEVLDCILANPPYIDRADTEIEEGVKKFEPQIALFSENRGYAHIFKWGQKAFELLKPGRRLFMEIGHTQGHEAKQELAQMGFRNIELLKDLSGKDRVIVAIK